MEKERVRTRSNRMDQKEKDFGWLFAEIILFLHKNIRAVIQIDKVIRDDLNGLAMEKDLRTVRFIEEYKWIRERVEIRKSIEGNENHNFFVFESNKKEEQLVIKRSFNI